MPMLRTFLKVGLLSWTLAATVCVARGDIVQSTPSLPPQNGFYGAGTICVPLGPGVCVVNPSLYGFNGTTRSFDNQGESIDSNILFSASIFTDNNGKPGKFLGPLSASGPIGILYSGRSSDSELGDFTSTLTEFDLTGTFNGHSIEIMLSNTPSTGVTSVDASGPVFLVGSFFDVFAEISIDHGQFMPGPERTFVLSTPEPASFLLLGPALLGCLGVIRHRMTK